MADTDLKGLAASWKLSTATPISGEDTTFLSGHHGGTDGESVFEPDKRTLVDKHDLRDGGRYRSIVKLFIRYQNQPNPKQFTIGTGYLIRPDLLVTAGHNVFDHANSFGPAVEIKAYLGYDGRGSTGSAGVQFRSGRQIVAPSEWVSRPEIENQLQDVAFVQLDKPFEGNLRLIQFAETPSEEESMIGVVGFPGDKVLDKEQGAQMYEEYDLIEFDRNKDSKGMLNYPLSTFSGQSGSPVLRLGRNPVSIGTHVSGAGLLNSASPIGSQPSNDYDKYISMFSHPLPLVVKSSNGIDHFDPAAPSDPNKLPGTANHTRQKRANPEPSWTQSISQEGFLDYVKKAARDVEPVVRQITAPDGRPIVSSVTALAGAALNVSAMLSQVVVRNPPLSSAETSWTKGSQEADLPNNATEGALERAIFAEAALVCVLRMDPSEDVVHGVLKDMRKIYQPPKLGSDGLVQALVPLIKDLSSRINADEDTTVSDPQDEADITNIHIQTTNQTIANAALSPEAQAFAQPLLDAPQATQISSQSFIEMLNSGLKLGAPLLEEGTRNSLKNLNGLAVGNAAESSTQNSPSPDTEALHLLTNRAFMAEAALQAVMKVNPRELQQTVLIASDGPEFHEESFFGGMRKIIEEIGKKIRTAGPEVVKSVEKLVVGTVAGTKIAT